MKVNTDGVLLGASMTIRPSDRCLLDIGTGTGTIALMAAQRLENMQVEQASVKMISAIDIDEASATEAAANFTNSPWADCLQAFHSSLDGFSAAVGDLKYDLIFSNTRYF